MRAQSEHFARHVCRIMYYGRVARDCTGLAGTGLRHLHPWHAHTMVMGDPSNAKKATYMYMYLSGYSVSVHTCTNVQTRLPKPSISCSHFQSTLYQAIFHTKDNYIDSYI